MNLFKKTNKRIAFMISGVFLFIGMLWFTIGEVLLPIEANPLLFQIAWTIVFISGVFGTGFAIIGFVISNDLEVKHEN